MELDSFVTVLFQPVVYLQETASLSIALVGNENVNGQELELVVVLVYEGFQDGVVASRVKNPTILDCYLSAGGHCWQHFKELAESSYLGGLKVYAVCIDEPAEERRGVFIADVQVGDIDFGVMREKEADLGVERGI